MGRTNVVIDDDLVKECQKLTEIRTRRALIDYALQELRRDLIFLPMRQATFSQSSFKKWLESRKIV
jgi:Arc/MetJ family transcription regulator